MLYVPAISAITVQWIMFINFSKTFTGSNSSSKQVIVLLQAH